MHPEASSDTGNDISKLRQLLIPQGVLVKNTAYRIRTRHRDNRGLWSSWSDPVAFTTVSVNPDDLDGNNIDDNSQVDGFVDTNSNNIDDKSEKIQAVYNSEERNTIGTHTNHGTLKDLDAVTTNEIPTTLLPEDPLKFGLFNFRIDGLPLDTNNPATTNITFYFPEELPSNEKWYKYDPINNTMTDFSAYAAIHKNRVVLTLTDGGPGDADGLVNGVIVDPGGISIPLNPSHLPYKTVNPTPENSATGIPVNTTVRWLPAEGTVSYKVYFGTTATLDNSHYKGISDRYIFMINKSLSPKIVEHFNSNRVREL